MRHHLHRSVDADDLAVVAKVFAERERGIAQTATYVKKTLTSSEVQLLTLPCSQPARRLPPCGDIHRGEEYRDVRILIDSLVAQAMRFLRRHALDATALWP